MRCDLVTALDPIGTTTQVGTNIINAVDWNNCNYLASGGNDLTDGIGIVAVYNFNQTTETLSPLEETNLEVSISSIAWCPAYNYLAAGASDGGNGIIQVYKFNSNGSPYLEPSGSSMLGRNVISIDWCQSCSYLVAGGTNSNLVNGIIQAYNFNGTSLSTIGSSTSTNMPITSLKLCGCQYLAAVDTAGNLFIFTFNSLSGLYFAASYAGTSIYSTVDWCNCGYIAAGGQNSDGFGIIDIYKFDPASTQSLSVVASATIFETNFQVSSLNWCQGCDNLAVCGANYATGENALLYLYHFDPSTMTLLLIQHQPSASLSPTLSWCATCSYLSVGGINQEQANAIIELYKSDFALPVPTVTAQKLYHRFPTQVDIINKLCWNPVSGAVAYNIYADANLTILLATITNLPLCYSQHQVCSGTVSTYYVTAVDANGISGVPAVVTI